MHRRLGVKIAKFRQKRCETALRQIALCLLVSLMYNFTFSVCLCVGVQTTTLQQFCVFPLILTY